MFTSNSHENEGTASCRSTADCESAVEGPLRAGFSCCGLLEWASHFGFGLMLFTVFAVGCPIGLLVNVLLVCWS
jgi:hypothetical protein